MKIPRRSVSVVLLHAPMVDRNDREVVTAVTNLDLHDIARSCRTFGVERYFVVNPEEEQNRLVRSILGHWHAEVSKVYHPARAEALGIISQARTFEEAFNEVSLAAGARPIVAMPDARDLREYCGEPWSYSKLRALIETGVFEGDLPGRLRPVLVVFGTGWGVHPKFFSNVDVVLKPLRRAGVGEGRRGYNHLSVRAAAAIVLDRLLGEAEERS